MAYTNSPLVKYTRISPNRTVNRNHAIDTITIHCVVGQCSAETIGAVFAPSSRQASSNYGIGYDGKIGMYCEEKDRSWCTSSPSNDHRAITIEVASDTTEPYAVNDKAYAALLDLVTDICKRNGIKKLVWSTNKNDRVNHLNGCNMTVHRDYANKSCPGKYLYDRHGAIAAEVNKRLGVSTGGGTSTVTPVTGTASTGSAADEKTIWNFLLGKIGNEYGVAGLMGNLYAESGLRSNNLQNAYEKSLGYTDAGYTSAVDNGKYTNFVKDSAGYGLAQWTYYTRKQALLDYAKSNKKSIGDLNTQLAFLYKELSESYAKTVLADLKNAKSVKAASDSVLTKFERPANQDDTVKAKRASYGQAYYDKYAKKPEAAKPVTPTQPTTPALKYAVGTIVQFAGGKHYASASATSGDTVKASKAKITAVYATGKHPYHCRAVNDAGAFIGGVYGWVDANTLSDVKAATATAKPAVIEKGDTVKITGTKYYSGAKIPDWVKAKKWIVYDAPAGKDRIVIDKSTDGKSSIMSPIKRSDLKLVSKKK